MSVSSIFKSIGKITVDHAPEILTGLSVVGTINTAVLTARATATATRVVDEHEIRQGRLDDPKDRFKERFNLVWRLYIPATISGVATVSMIICSNRMSIKRQAVVTSALVTTQEYLRRYEGAVKDVLDDNLLEKVEESYGKRVMEETEQPDLPENDDDPRETDIFLESLSGRYFRSTQADIRTAIASAKEQVFEDFYLSQNELYDMLNLEHVAMGDDYGWNTDTGFNVTLRPGFTKNDRPCTIITYSANPKAGSYRVY